jgi:hypothetical protein
MRISHVARSAAAAATLAVVTTGLAAPAQAAASDEHVKSAAARYVADHGAGTFSARDLASEGDLVDSMEDLSDVVCDPTGQGATLNSDLVLLKLVDSGSGPISALVSSDINLDDDPTTHETTCTFAFLVADTSTTFDGSYALTVTSDVPDGATVSLDPPKTVSAQFTGEAVPTKPVYTTVDEFADAVLRASGTTSKLSPAQRTVVDNVTTPRSAQAKKAAKKKYAKAIKAAKKKYAKAGKTKKAKKLLARQTAAAKRAYTAAITPTTTRVNRVETYSARTPWSIDATLNWRDDIRG